MSTEFQLAGIEKIASIILLTASAIFIETAIKTQIIEINKQKGIKSSAVKGPAPSRLFVAGEALFLCANILFYSTSQTRLKQVQQQAQTNRNVSVRPNEYITFGVILFVVGAMSVLAGGIMKDQQSNVAIL